MVLHALLDVVGNVVGWVLVAALVGGVLAVPASRSWLVRALLAALVRRRWRRALIDCGLPSVRARHVVRVPAGEVVQVRVPRGWSLAAVADRAEQVAVCLKLRELRVARDRGNAAWA